MPFGPHGEHVTIHLVDFTDLDRNQFTVTTQYTFRAGSEERRCDLVLLVNGFPLVIVEAKTPVRQAVSYADGAIQVHDNYEKFVPELFAPNVFSVATEGKDLRYGAVGAPLDAWGPWREDAWGLSGKNIQAAPFLGRMWLKGDNWRSGKRQKKRPMRPPPF